MKNSLLDISQFSKLGNLLLEVCSDSCLGVTSLKHHAVKQSNVLEPLGNRVIRAVHKGLLGDIDSQWRLTGDGLCQFHGSSHQLVVVWQDL